MFVLELILRVWELDGQLNIIISSITLQRRQSKGWTCIVCKTGSGSRE